MGMKVAYNPLADSFDFTGQNSGGGTLGYPVNYVGISNLVLPATGAPVVIDGGTLTNNEYVLFPSLTVTANRGVYRATVVAGNVTAWTRIVYNPSASPIGESIMGDTIYVTEGTIYTNYTFTCTDSVPLAIWLGRAVHYPNLKNEIWINSSVQEQIGIQYKNYANARAYIATQTPTSTNRWVIKCSQEIGTGVGGTGDASCVLDPYVYIDLNTSGIITVHVTCSGGFTGDVYEYMVVNGEITDLRTSSIFIKNFKVSGANLPNGAVMITDSVTFYDGDFTGTNGGTSPTDTPTIEFILGGIIAGGHFKDVSIQGGQLVGQLSGTPQISIDSSATGSATLYDTSWSSQDPEMALMFKAGNYMLRNCIGFNATIPTGQSQASRLFTSALLMGGMIPYFTLATNGYWQINGGVVQIYGPNFAALYSNGVKHVRVTGTGAPWTTVYAGVLTLSGGGADGHGQYFIATAYDTGGAYTADVNGIVDRYVYRSTGYEQSTVPGGIVATTTGRLYVDAVIGYVDVGKCIAIQAPAGAPSYFTNSFVITKMGFDPTWGHYIEFVTSTSAAVHYAADTTGLVTDTTYSVFADYSSNVYIAACPNIGNVYKHAGANIYDTGVYCNDVYGIASSYDSNNEIRELAKEDNVMSGQTIGAGVGSFEGVALSSINTWETPDPTKGEKRFQIMGLSLAPSGTKRKVLLRGKYPYTGIIGDGAIYFDASCQLTATLTILQAGYVFTDANSKKWIFLNIENDTQYGSTLIGISPAKIAAPKIYHGTTDPLVTDDDSGTNVLVGLAFFKGALYNNDASGVLWKCKDPATGAAVWEAFATAVPAPYPIQMNYYFMGISSPLHPEEFTLPAVTGMPIHEYHITCKNAGTRCSVRTNNILNKFIFPSGEYIVNTTEYVFKQEGTVIFRDDGTNWYVDESQLKSGGRLRIHDNFINVFNPSWVADAGNQVAAVSYEPLYGIKLTTLATLGDTVLYTFGGHGFDYVGAGRPSMDMKLSIYGGVTNKTDFEFGLKNFATGDYIKFINEIGDSYYKFMASESANVETLPTNEAVSVGTMKRFGFYCYPFMTLPNVTSITGDGTTATIVFAATQYLKDGDYITLTGWTGGTGTWDGDYKVTVTAPNEVTILCTGNGTATGGLITTNGVFCECFIDGVSKGRLTLNVPHGSLLEPYFQVKGADVGNTLPGAVVLRLGDVEQEQR